MRDLLHTIDKLLRGGFTSQEELLQGRIDVSVRTLALIGIVLGAIYGVFMGIYGTLRTTDPSLWQLAMTTAKVPVLFLLTLVVTFPSLYVFSALAGSILGFVDTLRLLLVGIVVNLALLASFGPVTGFFTLSTESYPFMIVLNVVFFAIGGVISLVFMYRALESIIASRASRAALPASGEEAGAGSARRVKAIFCTWVVIYGAVGAQMGWILRPFIGSPNLPVELFRKRESNFFEALFRTIGDLFQ